MPQYGDPITSQSDDGFELYESRATARHLAETYGADSGFIPRDPRARARFEQTASVEMTNFDAHAGPVVGKRVFKPRVLPVLGRRYFGGSVDVDTYAGSMAPDR